MPKPTVAGQVRRQRIRQADDAARVKTVDTPTKAGVRETEHGARMKASFNGSVRTFPGRNCIQHLKERERRWRITCRVLVW